jgi:hypothetical protein
METNVNQLNLTAVPAVVHEAITALAALTNEILGKQIRGITVVGSCLTQDYVSGVSDINTVLLLDQLDQNVLEKIVGLAGRLPKKHHLALPLLMTEAYITRSCDVFGMEFLDFQLSHQAVWGQDPFVKLSFAKDDVRLQCERELKASLIRLRQGFIAARAKAPILRDVLIGAIKTVLPLLRAMLWLTDQQRAPETETTLTRAAQAFSLDLAPFKTIISWHRERAKPKMPDLTPVFSQTYTLIDQLADRVDEWEAA